MNIMNKLVCLLLCLLGLLVNAKSQKLEPYRLPEFNTVEQYQQFVGKTITYYPIFRHYGYNEKANNLGYDIRDFLVVSVSGKTRNRPYQKTEWTLKDVKTDKIETLTVYIGKSIPSLEDDKYVISFKDFQFIQYEKWKEEQRNKIGTIYSDPIVKATYKVVDINLEKVSSPSSGSYLLTIYSVENSITGEIYKYTETAVDWKCFSEDKAGSYHIFLSKVEKPANPLVKFGKTTMLTEESSKGVTKCSYVDNLIDIIIFGSSTEFHFVLKNISDYTQKLLWDEAVFISVDGTTSKVVHSGVKYSERFSAQSPSILIKDAVLSDIACPVDNIYYDEKSKDWRTYSMYPKNRKPGQVKLMLPIQIQGVTNEYIFVFDIKYVFEHPERVRLDATL